MSNSNFKMADRILSILLAIIMIVSLMPITVFASTEANPGKFTVTVKNESDEPITDAEIFYEIFVDSELKVNGNLSTTNGEAVIPNVSDYSDDIADESKSVEISYEITKDGYNTVNKKVTVTDVAGSITETLTAVMAEKVNVIVAKNGDGTVYLNNKEITSQGCAVDKGSEVLISVTPDEGSYIKEVQFGDNNIEKITDPQYFEKTITADEDITVSVTFVKTFTVEVTKNDGGTVKLNSEAVTSRVYDENDTAEINVIPVEGYQIDSVKIGDKEQSVDDVNNFSTSFSVTQDVNVAVSFVKVYVINVSYDGNNGTVETDPECVGGSITVKTGTIVSVKATPAYNYRVLNVVINDQMDIETTDNTYDNSNPYTKKLSANQNYTIKITFALKLCNINVNVPEHGSVSVESNSVNYGDDTTVTIIPDSGYVVNTVRVDDADLTDKLYTKDESALELKLENITSDKDIQIEFKLSESATIDNITWNDSKALRTAPDENLYVFAEGSSVTFYTSKEAIRINGKSKGKEWRSSEWSINENIKITKIELYYDLGWHEVMVDGKSVQYNIVFDADAPVPTMSISRENEYGYYNTDVPVTIEAVDNGNYSGINTVEYWITCDGIETERKTLYAYSDGDEIKSKFPAQIITVNADKNNSDNVVVYLEVTDRAGNNKQITKNLKINSTVPVLSVSIDGTLDSKAMEGYYNSDRIATVKIVDRASCFDETLAEDGICISAVDAKENPVNITKASMIAWTHNGDTHTATITFSEEANYSWSVSYKSKSGLSNIGIISETGDSIYNFAVDKTAPTGTISIDADNKWDTLLSSLTFGIWKNYSVTATADGRDDISPIYDIKYYKSNSDTALSESELINLYDAGKFTTEEYTVSADELFVVYARISDYAGNTLFIGSNGIIVDTTGSENQITLTPDKPNASGYYNSDVNVDIEVDEEVVSGQAYSGIKTVDYLIQKDGVKTQEENLFTFDISNPSQEQLVNEWTGSITVDASLNNSDNVKVIVTVTDNAGNEYSKDISLSINSTDPGIAMSFDNNNANRIDGNRGYFERSRTATITITDRNSTFNEETATEGITITAVDAKGKTVEDAYIISNWKTTEGETPDAAKHTATIHFDKDANYTFAIEYTDKADNKNTEPDVTGQVTPYEFTVDTTKPTGTVTVENNTWNKLLNVLTFGLYKNSTAEVKATADDDTSPVVIEYYKTSNATAMTEKELDGVTDWTVFENSALEQNGVSPDEQFVIYLKITDYAGNYTYINSDGYIVEKSESKIVLTPEKPNNNGIYGLKYKNGINVDVKITDSAPYSGIKTVDYWIEKDGVKTQEDNLFTFDILNPTQKQLVNEWTGSITVDPTINNSCDAVVYVKTVDNAGNENTESVALDIDVTAPTIKITYDDTNKADAKEGYFTSRTATVVITERTHHFDSVTATEGINITAVDGNGKAILNAYTISDWNTSEGNTSDDATHTATIQFKKDANYTFAIGYTDNADNKNTTPDVTGQTTPYNFTVDTTKPTGTVTVENNTWNKLLNVLTFGLYKNSTAEVSATAKDDTSPVVIDYYKTSNTTAMTEAELDNVMDWAAFEGSDIEQNGILPNEQFVIYLRITDYAGNYTYINSDGYIVEKEKSEIVITPDEPNENGIYGLEYENGINVDIKVTDSEPYSGIKTVDYWIEKDGVKTQEDNLFTFNISNPTQKQLLNKWTGSITVDPTINNSCDTVVYVKTVDNAGNENTKSVSLDIDMAEPKIKITYDDAVNVDAKEGYFTSRTATVVITERTHHFDPKIATEGITITAVDAKGKTVEDAYTISDWKTSEGETPDAAKHTATIQFDKDANYTFAIEYTDKADNKNTEPDVTGQITPYEFTVDTTKPTGTVTVENNTWNKLLNVLTFGLYKNGTAEVSATADDDTSPVVIEYYKTSNATAMTEKELDAVTDWTVFENSALEQNGVSPDEQFVIYLKITDYAGNYTYINSDGYIVEKTESKIVLTPEKPNNNGIYGLKYKNGINVDVKITDSAPYSGIKTVDYWIEKDGVKTQEDNLFTFDISNPTQKQLVNEWTGSITVDPTINNSCDAVVYVKTVDNAGNENTKSVSLDIDMTEPKIKITYDNTVNADAKEGYFTSRTATVVLTERTHHFDSVTATEGINITAVDGNGKAISNAYTISDWKTSEGNTSDDATHTATIQFKKDANYTFAIGYTDNADNKNTTPDVTGQTTPYKFTVDTTKPTGTVTVKSSEGRKESWSSLVDSLTFGFWSNKKISVSGISNDVTSPIASVQYYMPVAKNAGDETTALNVAALDKIDSWKSFNGFDVTDNKQFTVYLKITDNAGNYTYVGTNGLIVDDRHPVVESVAPEITVTPEKPVNGIYKDDVKVSIKVDDPMVSGTYSGLKEIAYKVFDRASASPNTPTQGGTLYTFNKSNPKQSELLKTWTGNITVESAKNNSNNIQIVVYAVDNAGNAGDNSQKNSSGYKIIKIDTTAPVIDISYNNNNADSNTYFKENRVATIKITERNFNAKDVKIKVTKYGSEVNNSLDWNDVSGSYNLDNSTHTATITYSADGDYTFAIEYTDLAGNKCTSINFAEGTVAESKFTIDKTLPTIEVSYDNNSAQNSNYYKESRTATIVITEHNFNPDRVDVTMTATDDGAEKTVPKLNGWTSNGDRHTATINYNDDAKYTFDIAFKDMAGNDAADFANQTFYVDKTVPSLEITGVKDKSANSGAVIPVVTYTDTNFDDSQVNITLVGANRKNVALLGNYSDIHNGKVFTFDNFAKEKDIDDIYTLNATLTDKAGNTSAKSINFSVNRFGSTYVLSDETATLNGSYAKTPIDIVLTEINANELKNIKITLFKNDKTIVLEEGTDYRIDVTGGNGQWYQYKYTIFKENFEEDGVYRLSIHSEDAAGNIAENTLDTKDKEINFGVDKTPPTINAENLESEKTYALENMIVQMSVNDNLKLVSAIVYLDGKECSNWKDEDLDKILADGENFTFEISGDSTSAHNVKIIATDAAGNENVEEISNFYVTTNILVRYFNNKPLFFGSIAGVIVIAGLIIFLVVFKGRKKEDKNKNQ